MLWFQAVWQSYVHAMRLAGFSNNTSVYVASGLLTYGAEHGNALLAASFVRSRNLPTSIRLRVESTHQKAHILVPRKEGKRKEMLHPEAASMTEGMTIQLSRI
jgi:hypothetical protein